jgi:choline dehydrogenase-like flavoprotein
LFDVVIIGSGASGVHAARQLSRSTELNICVIDVGLIAPSLRLPESPIHEIRQSKTDCFQEFVGSEFEAMNNIASEYLMPKIKSPLLRFVTNGPNGELLKPKPSNFMNIESLAKGGLANLWGAQVYQFQENDLLNFPFKINELEPYFTDLAEHIGISGTEKDDLQKFFGSKHILQPPLQIGRLGTSIENAYIKNKKEFNQKNVYLGRPRLAVLTKDLADRKACRYFNHDFFQANAPEVYNPSFTLNTLLKEKKITYLDNMHVLTFNEKDNIVNVEGINLKDKEKFSISCRKLIIAAGTMSTSRIVVQSSDQLNRQLPILDNQISYIPILNPKLIGAGFDQFGFSTMLNIVVQNRERAQNIFGTFYSTQGILRSELLYDFKLSTHFNMVASKYILPALGVLQLWYPDAPKENNHISFLPNGQSQISYKQQTLGTLEKMLCRLFLKSGLISAYPLCKYPAAGNSFHYAGTLPMKDDPTYFQTDPFGKLFGYKNVNIVDGSVFPTLPSKNLTFTVMANSMRIAEHLRKELGLK